MIEVCLDYLPQNPNFIACAMAMFCNYFASSLRSPLHRLAAAAAATPFPRIVLLRLSLLSTYTAASKGRLTASPDAKTACPMSDFLLNDIGLCQSEVSTMFKLMPALVRTRSNRTSQKAVHFLRASGFTEYQVRKIITRCPHVLCLNADRKLKPMIELMKTLGVTAQELGNAISRQPRLLGCNLEKTLSPNIQYVRNLFRSDTDVSKVFKWASEILTLSNGPETLEKRLKHLASFGVSEDDIKELARRNPVILTFSMDKVQKSMDYFIHTAGLPAEFLLTHSKLLSCSLECKIKPRHRVLKSISAMQPSKHLPNLTYAFLLSEQQFLEKYVKCSPHATKLLEIYSGKPVDLDIIQ